MHGRVPQIVDGFSSVAIQEPGTMVALPCKKLQLSSLRFPALHSSSTIEYHGSSHRSCCTNSVRPVSPTALSSLQNKVRPCSPKGAGLLGGSPKTVLLGCGSGSMHFLLAGPTGRSRQRISHSGHQKVVPDDAYRTSWCRWRVQPREVACRYLLASLQRPC